MKKPSKIMNQDRTIKKKSRKKTIVSSIPELVSNQMEDLHKRAKIEKNSILESLKESEEKYRFIAEKMHDVIWIVDLNLRTTYVSQSVKAVLGFTQEERLAQKIEEQVTPSSLSIIQEAITRELANEQHGRADPNRSITLDIEYYHKDGSTRWFENVITAVRNKRQILVGFHGVSRDITEQKQAERLLIKEIDFRNILLELYEKASQLPEKQLFDYVLEQAVRLTDSRIGFLHLVSDDQKGIILTTWNKEALKDCTANYDSHYPIAQAGNWVDCVRLGHPVIYNEYAESPNRKGFPKGHAAVRRFMSIPVMDGDKIRIIFGVGNKTNKYDDHDVVHIQLVANELQKICRQHHAEQRVTQLAAIVESSEDAIIGKRLDGLIMSWNKGAENIYGYKESEVINRSIAILIPLGQKDDVAQILEKVKSGEHIEHYETMRRKKDGQNIHVSLTISPIRDTEGRIVAASTIGRDITERKRAEESLRQLNRELQAISKCNQTLLRAVDEQTLINDICRIICEEAGYRLAWVGYAEHDDAKTVRPVAWAGFDSDYIAAARLTWADDTERGRGPAGKAIRSGEIVYVQDFASDLQMVPWRESALRHGYRSGIALPLKDGSAEVFGVLLIYSAEANTITPEEIRLMEELSGDLAFGIISLRTRDERMRAEEALLFKSMLLEAQSETSIDGILAVDNEGHAILFNKRFGEIWKIPQGVLDSKDDKKMLECVLNQLKDPVEFSRKVAYLYEHKDEKSRDEIEFADGRFMDRYSSPLIGIDGNYYGRIWYFRDITERRQAESQREAILKELQISLVEKEVLLKEVHHRVKNNLMTIIGLINMEEAKANNEMFNVLLLEIEGRVRSMALVHESLYKSEDFAHIDLQNYIETLAAHIRAQFGAERDIRLSVQAAGMETDLDLAVPCGLILNELITNACKHAFPGGKSRSGEGNCEIVVTVKQDNGSCTLTVADNGIGLPRGINWENPETLGLRLVKMLCQQIKGAIEMDRTNGTAFLLHMTRPFQSR